MTATPPMANMVYIQWLLLVMRTTCVGVGTAALMELDYAGTASATILCPAIVLLLAVEFALCRAGRADRSAVTLGARLCLTLFVMYVQYPAAQYLLSGAEEEVLLTHGVAALPCNPPAASTPGGAAAPIIALSPASWHVDPTQWVSVASSPSVLATRMFPAPGCQLPAELYVSCTGTPQESCLQHVTRGTALLRLTGASAGFTVSKILPFTLEEATDAAATRKHVLWAVAAGAWACALLVLLLLTFIEHSQQLPWEELDGGLGCDCGEDVEEEEEVVEEGGGLAWACSGGFTKVRASGRSFVDDAVHSVACGALLSLGILVHTTLSEGRLFAASAASTALLTGVALLCYTGLLFLTGYTWPPTAQ